MGGQRRQIGDVVIAANGYSYTYVRGSDGKPERIPTSWIVGHEKYGRYPDPKHERVRFLDGDKLNFDPRNIEYVKMNGDRKQYLRRHIVTLKERIKEAQSELLDAEIELSKLEREQS